MLSNLNVRVHVCGTELTDVTCSWAVNLAAVLTSVRACPMGTGLAASMQALGRHTGQAVSYGMQHTRARNATAASNWSNLNNQENNNVGSHP